MTMQYKDPAGGTPSSIGSQIRTDYYNRKALVDTAKERYFTPLASVTEMPKHYGKKIKRFHYMPLLDERNVNDQGIDANGTTLVTGEWSAWDDADNLLGTAYADETAARTAAGADGTVAENGGNLYGSSKDVGVITAKLPVLSETGGRVNRVGFKRLEIEGTMQKFGFFDEYTKESMDFDSDAEKMQHITTEMLRGANEIYEDTLQIELLHGAGTVRYPGAATQDSEITGEDGAVTEVTYDDLMRFSIDLDNNRTPKHTKIISGSRMIDTKVIDSTRILAIGSELRPTVTKMADPFGNKAFIPVQHYAHSGTVMNGEIGTLDQFRIVVVPEMQHWAGRGATVTTNAGYRETNGRYDIFPMLCIGSESFTTIGFFDGGKGSKFKIYHKAPGREMADLNNPYGEVGFMSIKWWYGTLILRPERLGLIKTVATI